MKENEREQRQIERKRERAKKCLNSNEQVNKNRFKREKRVQHFIWRRLQERN